MEPTPGGTALDRTLAALRDPYRFIGRAVRRHGSPVVATRLLLAPAVCVTGPAAAAEFQDDTHFTRHRAVPPRVVRTLFGKGGVQGLDGAEHRHRKALFVDLMGADRVAELAALVDRELVRAARSWPVGEPVVLYDAFRAVLTRAVCAWAGVPLPTVDAERRTRELTALFDGAGAVGPRHWRARLARRAADRWAADVVRRVRAGRITPPEDTAAHAAAWHRAPDGALLPPHTAGVELLNVLRPTVAVAVYLAFAAHALHHHPRCARAVGDEAAADGGNGTGGYTELFAQEVRRHYPFFPAVAARARFDLLFQGHPVKRGRRVLLDLYGINHDPRRWGDPEEFRPERFAEAGWDLYGFVPQGAGDPSTGHRCPGEPITVALIAAVARRLVRMRYEVPEQDDTVDMARLPALPRSGCVIRPLGPPPE
ncbi:cytochrome P450 [Streptomonospora nanhaiensis]|uniref:Fatty-acid peroxygenase n=1 Tax=Streptomonospora nanhaiensis TaxID=1323731 RepID=A0A853BI93_9ACTN|nr:cytochrome P450 [Streptomonospora nanhaiensis]MBV2362342.1 cytochrome P450 [Streptomonospora nanhaiensis]MBX9391340.1 cytochrome P450 [Streptomonospora nanhaiensis]NYI95003.1 fatty-acid peroxygenase [Streptomonospora nanhaiensis]